MRRGNATSFKEKYLSAQQLASHLSEVSLAAGEALAHASVQVTSSRKHLTSALSEVLGEASTILQDQWIDDTVKEEFSNAIAPQGKKIPIDRLAQMSGETMHSLLMIICNQREIIDVLGGATVDLVNIAESNISAYNKAFSDQEVVAGPSFSIKEDDLEDGAGTPQVYSATQSGSSDLQRALESTQMIRVPASASSSIAELIADTEGPEM